MVISEDRYFSMVATLVSGILSNPVNACGSLDEYTRQNVIKDVMHDLHMAFSVTGVSVVSDLCSVVDEECVQHKE